MEEEMKVRLVTMWPSRKYQVSLPAFIRKDGRAYQLYASERFDLEGEENF